jgi:hypothetical protein
MRFTLANLLIAVALVALTCAGLLNRTRILADGILTLTVLIYVVVGIRSFLVSGRDRAVSIVFSSVGIMYLLLVFKNVLPVIRDSLITNDALEAVYQLVPKSSTEAKPNFGPTYPWHHLGWLFGDELSNEPRRHFVLVGHCAFSWLIALFTGWFAGFIYKKWRVIE